ncbi:hypothetical protein EVAR_12110_1 [Eumeta japonica]|uniref:Uncharacterized protein n=1 Tax=Eumeta variegata TaxID=151549 RepID=A0A4C1U5D1_EUMVA|nr:hypothetical protein EVAR_12110_1 [Eumeta japonica]
MISGGKKRKVDAEGRQFKQKWTEELFFILHNAGRVAERVSEQRSPERRVPRRVPQWTPRRVTRKLTRKMDIVEAGVAIYVQQVEKRKKRQYWIHPSLEERRNKGLFATFFSDSAAPTPPPAPLMRQGPK